MILFAEPLVMRECTQHDMLSRHSESSMWYRLALIVHACML